MKAHDTVYLRISRRVCLQMQVSPKASFRYLFEGRMDRWQGTVILCLGTTESLRTHGDQATRICK